MPRDAATLPAAVFFFFSDADAYSRRQMRRRAAPSAQNAARYRARLQHMPPSADCRAPHARRRPPATDVCCPTPPLIYADGFARPPCLKMAKNVAARREGTARHQGSHAPTFHALMLETNTRRVQCLTPGFSFPPRVLPRYFRAARPIFPRPRVEEFAAHHSLADAGHVPGEGVAAARRLSTAAISPPPCRRFKEF